MLAIDQPWALPAPPSLTVWAALRQPLLARVEELINQVGFEPEGTPAPVDGRWGVMQLLARTDWGD